MFLVTGGTGFVGSAIVRELVARGEQVAVLGRDAERIRQRLGDKVEARAGDVTRPESLAPAMQGVDVVVNAVQFPGSPIENKRRGWTFENIDLKGTLSQITAAKAAGVRRFVYVSGVGAAPGAEKHWFRYKWDAEQHLANSGLEWSIVRPTWVYGKDDNSLNKLLRFGNFLPFIPTFGDGMQAMQPVFIADVGRVLADAATRPEAANQLFELGGPDVMTMDEVLKTALSVMGRRRIILHAPVFVGKTMGRLASLLPTPPLSADAVDFVTSPAVADTARLMELLHPQLTPYREGLATYLGK